MGLKPLNSCLAKIYLQYLWFTLKLGNTKVFGYNPYLYPKKLFDIVVTHFAGKLLHNSVIY